MDREGAETYLRLLAEAALRGSLTPAAESVPGATRMMVAGHALTAVGALDPLVAEEILTDFRLAVSVRQLRGEPGPGPGQVLTGGQWIGHGPAVVRRQSYLAPPPAMAPSGSRSRPPADQERAGRFVPVGLTVPFSAGAISGELCLMSFAQTGAGIGAAAALRPRPAVTVVLTDGYTPWPAAAPKGMRVVVGLIGEHAPDAPSWTRAVRVEP